MSNVELNCNQMQVDSLRQTNKTVLVFSPPVIPHESVRCRALVKMRPDWRGKLALPLH